MSASSPRGRSSLVAGLRAEGGSLWHAHVLRLRTVVIKQGHASGGLFLIVEGEARIEKEMEIVHRSGSSSSGAMSAGGRTAVVPSVEPLHRRTIKPVEVAILGAGDYFGDIGLLDGANTGSGSGSSTAPFASDSRLSPVTVVVHSARLEVLFIRRSDLLRAISKPLLRALRAHSSTRTAAHAARVQKVLDAIGAGVTGRVRHKRADSITTLQTQAQQALHTFWSQTGTTDATNSNSNAQVDYFNPNAIATPSAAATSDALLTSSSPIVTVSTPSAAASVSTPSATAAPLALPSTTSASSSSHRAPASTKPVLTKAALEERKAKKEKEHEALQESLNKRYQTMKLKSQRLFFPEPLLRKIRAQVVAESAAGLRVTKALGSLLVAPSEPLAADASEREKKDTFKFYGEALRSAETRRAMTTTTIGSSGGSGGNGNAVAALLQNDARHAQHRFEEAAAAQKLGGALDALLRDERARQQQEREQLLGNDGVRKRPRIPSAHFNSAMMPTTMTTRASIAAATAAAASGALAHGPRLLRGAEALLARSERERRREEAEMHVLRAQLERTLAHQEVVNGGVSASAPTTARPFTAPDAPSGLNAASHTPRPTIKFSINTGLDTEYLTTDHGVKETPSGASRRAHTSHTARERQRSLLIGNTGDLVDAHGTIHSSTGGITAYDALAPTYAESLHRLAASPPNEAARLLTRVYAPDAFRASPDATVRRAHAAAERFGRDMESLPPPPERPDSWKPTIDTDLDPAERDETLFAVPAIQTTATASTTATNTTTPSERARAREQQRAMMGEVLASPAPPRLHSAAPPARKNAADAAAAAMIAPLASVTGVAPTPRSVDADPPPRAFADAFYSFSSASRSPLPAHVRTPRASSAVMHSPRSNGTTTTTPAHRNFSAGRSGRAFFPSVKAHTPPVLLAGMPSPVLDSEDGGKGATLGGEEEPPLETPQGILARRARAREAAEREEAATARRLAEHRQPLDAQAAFEADRSLAVQALAARLDRGSLDGKPPNHRRASMEKYQPLPVAASLAPSATRAQQDDFLLGNFRVAAWKRASNEQGTPSSASATRRRKRHGRGPSAAGFTSFSSTTSSSSARRRTGSIDFGARGVAFGPPLHARAFARIVLERIAAEERTRRARESAAAVSSPAGRVRESRRRSRDGTTTTRAGAGSELSPARRRAAADHEKPNLSQTTMLAPPTVGDESTARAVTAPAVTPVGGLDSPPATTSSSRPPRSPRAPLDAPRSPRILVRKETTLPPPPTAIALPESLPVPTPVESPLSPRARRLRFTALLSDPSNSRAASQGPVRPHRVGSPWRLASRLLDADDARLALAPLTEGLATTVRARLLRAVEERAEALARKEARRAYRKAHRPPTRATELIRATRAKLHIVNAASAAAHKGNEEKSAELNVGEQIGANVQRLDILASIPPPPPLPPAEVPTTESESPKKKSKKKNKKSNKPDQHTTDLFEKPPSSSPTDSSPLSHARSGTEAASGGALATSFAPLSRELRENGLGGMWTGLTAVSQMLPPSHAARKLAELYAHFQRHLARTRDYFRANRNEVATPPPAGIDEEEGNIEDDAHSPQRDGTVQGTEDESALSSSHPVRLGRHHRVDSQGFVLGPDRIAPSLAPGAFGRDAASWRGASSIGAADSPSPVRPHGRDGARRRGGDQLGMLDASAASSGEDVAVGVSVLADMVARDSLENAQALRVLSSYDRRKMVYLPTALLHRAQQLHELLERRAAEETAAKEARLEGPAAATRDDSSDSSSDDSSSRASDDSDASTSGDDDAPMSAVRVAHMRARARKKARNKFRLLPGIVDLFRGSNSTTAAPSSSTPTTPAAAVRYRNMASTIPITSPRATDSHVKDSKENGTRLVESDAARRVVSAVTAANRARLATPPTPSPPPSRGGSRSSGVRSRVGLSVSDARVVNAPLPPAFMSMYESYGLRPAAVGGHGFESTERPPSPPPPAPGMSLVQIVRARANLERKLKQDEFVLRGGEETSSGGGTRTNQQRNDNADNDGGGANPEETLAAQRRRRELRALEAEEAELRRANSATSSTFESVSDANSAFTSPLASPNAASATDASRTTAATTTATVGLTPAPPATFTFPSVAALAVSPLTPAHAAVTAMLAEDGDEEETLDVAVLLARMASQRAATADTTKATRPDSHDDEQASPTRTRVADSDDTSNVTSAMQSEAPSQIGSTVASAAVSAATSRARTPQPHTPVDETEDEQEPQPHS